MTFIISLLIALSTPCATEDADQCYWDAASQGNHEGQSFLVMDGEVHYITRQ